MLIYVEVNKKSVISLIIYNNLQFSRFKHNLSQQIINCATNKFLKHIRSKRMSFSIEISKKIISRQLFQVQTKVKHCDSYFFAKGRNIEYWRHIKSLFAHCFILNMLSSLLKSILFLNFLPLLLRLLGHYASIISIVASASAPTIS